MLFLKSDINDPYYNLATEEYLLRQLHDDVFMLWISRPAIIVGKHQNALAEVNYRFAIDQRIDVARRLTGGGAVFHDQGNINFAFIRTGESGRLVDFNAFIEPVTAFLQTLGVEAIRGPKNEILVNGLKISGNAEHVYKNRVLHHGTLLYQSDIDRLRESLNRSGGKYTDRAVQSNRSSVTNLADCMDSPLPVQAFCEALMLFMMNRYGGSVLIPDDVMKSSVDELARGKYSTWEWIYGWSPDYIYENQVRLSSLDLQIVLSVSKGIIRQCTLASGQCSSVLIQSLMGDLTGVRHEASAIRGVLMNNGIGSCFGSGVPDELVWSFF